jgi:hypothetical protein
LGWGQKIFLTVPAVSAFGGKEDIDVRLPTAWRNSMTKSALIVVASAVLLGGTSLASAKTGGAAGAHSKPSRPSINEVTPRPTVADPYYRLSASYYGYSDPYRGLFDFFAVPPYSPGNAYRYVKPVGRP